VPKVPTNATATKDLEAAGVVRRDDSDQVVDLHSLRGWFGSRLARSGVPSMVLRDLMRHSSVVTSERHYVRLRLHDLAGSLLGLPRLSGAIVEVAVATGTDGASVAQPQQIPQHSPHGT